MVKCIDCGGEIEWINDKELECTKCGRIYEKADDDDDESLIVYDAAEIWASHGKDEDYMFGYSEEELEAAL